jgi:hypothetical protein
MVRKSQEETAVSALNIRKQNAAVIASSIDYYAGLGEGFLFLVLFFPFLLAEGLCFFGQFSDAALH